MSESPGSDPTATGEPATPDELRADIIRTRAELAGTVDELSAKLDVKAQASDKVQGVKDSAAHAVDRAKQSADRAKQSAPEPVRNAVDSVTATAGRAGHSVGERAKPFRRQILFGAGGAVVAALVLRSWRRRRGD